MNRLPRKLQLINAKDLIFVILYGGVLPIVLGIAFAMIDYYIQSVISFSFYMIFFFVAAQLIGSLVRKQYEEPHLVYSLISLVFMLIMGLIIYILPSVYSDAIANNDFSLLYNVGYYLSYLYYFVSLLISSFSFNLMLFVLLLVVGTYLGIRRTY